MTKTVEFLNEINLKVKTAMLDGKALVLGISIDHGISLVDENKLKHSGGLLHEAAHLAVMPSDRRMKSQDNSRNKAADK